MTFPQASDVQQGTQAYPNVDAVLRMTLIADIWTAAFAGTRTTSAVTWTAVSEAQILSIIGDLQRQGFGVTLGSGTITITW